VRPRTLLVLLVLVLGLAAFIRFYERDLPSSDERAKTAKQLLDLKKDQVTRVRLEADGHAVVLERRPGAKPAKAAGAAGGVAGTDAAALQAELATPAADWRIVQGVAGAASPPRAPRADSATVDRLLDSLASLEKTRTLDQVVPAEVGLDKPRAVVGLTVAGKRSETVLDFGAAVPGGASTIVAIAGRPGAYVVSDSVLADVRKKPGDWRDRQMFHGDRDRIERLSWSAAGGPRLVLAKRGDRFWLESPFPDRADRDQVEKLLTDLTGVSAESFLDGSPAAARPVAQLGLEPPRAVLEAAIAGQPQPYRLELGASHAAAAPAAQPGGPEQAGSLTWARADGALFETRSGLAETLGRPPAAWRSPLLSGLEVHQVDSVGVRDARGSLALTRSGTDWKRGAAVISYLPVSDLLFAVTEAKADRLLTPEEAKGLGAGAAQPLITFDLKGGLAGNETLTIYPPLSGSAAGVPARASGRETVLLLPAAKLKDIQDRLEAVRAAKPLAPEKPAKK
jgi:hypothetical protein